MTNKDNAPQKSNNGTKEKKVSSSDKNSNDKKLNKPLWKRYFLSLLLLLGIIIAVVWGMVENNSLEKSYKAKIEKLNSDHEKSIDSIVREKAKLITSTLALAVRSELIDENKDQVNQYFLQMIKNKQISKIMLVNHNSGEIIMSTNKKDESTTFQNNTLLNAKDIVSESMAEAIMTATPVMGLNTQMAVLIVETSK